MREVIPEPLDGERLDRVVAMVADVSRSAAATAIAGGQVELDGAPVVTRSRRVAVGQVLEISGQVASPAAIATPDPTVELAIVHVDDHVIVIDKAAGQVVHPGAGNEFGTIAQGVSARFPEVADVGDPARPGIVHRLDKGTTGLLVVARSVSAHESLTSQLRRREVHRRYLTIVWGVPKSSDGIIEAPIGRAIRDPTRMTVKEGGKDARTRYRIESSWDDRLALLSCRLESGRTHQIRVHLEAIGHPVVADRRYGPPRERFGLDRPALHAAELGFRHPADGREMTFDSPVPADMQAVIDGFGPPTWTRSDA